MGGERRFEGGQSRRAAESDYLAHARRYGIPEDIAQRLWRELSEDPRCLLAEDPAQWREATFVAMIGRARQAGAALEKPGKRTLLDGDTVLVQTIVPSSPGKQTLREPQRELAMTPLFTSGASTPSNHEGPVVLRSPDPGTPLEEGSGDSEAPLEMLRYSRGSPLPAEVQRSMERLFGQPFADVLIHVDNGATAAAGSIRARAFTIANHVFFREGAYAPDTSLGLELLAHELTHVLQWRRGRVPSTASGRRVSDPGDSLEQEARTIGGDIARRASLSDQLLFSAPGRAPTAPLAVSSAPSVVHSGEIALRDGPPTDPHASLDTVPAGGTPIGRIGIVAWDGAPPLRLRSSASTTEDNIISGLAFNTRVQVIKEFPGRWYLVSTEHGQIGYAARDYVRTDLPEPNATLHRVAAGLPGYAISIADTYYRRWADDWGQDLRFYVNVLAWVNGRRVPNTVDGWRDVHFNAGAVIWIPSHDFARTLRGVVNSGSLSFNAADAIGLADFADRAEELRNDFDAAIRLSARYLPEAIGRHVEAALVGVLESIMYMMALAIGVLAITTAIGGLVGAAPGAAVGFEIGMVLLQWLGLGMLVVWVAQSILRVASAFGSFLVRVWNARGDQRQLDAAAQLFAEAIGTLCGVILEGLVMWAVSIGATRALAVLRGTRFGRSFNNSSTGRWLNERVRRVSSGETPIPTPRAVYERLIRGVELMDANSRPVGEFDGIDMSGQRFVENKSAAGLDVVTPRTGLPQQTPAQWAARQIGAKTLRRIQALATAVSTRGPSGQPAPTLAEIQGFRRLHFVIDANTPALRAAVFAELASLRTEAPGWTFTVEFGGNVVLPPVPGTGQPDRHE